ncbi:hypothetical protein CPIN18021_1115 [Campylobacter pinnipediorum subsp. caledonicus]|uniref:TolA protein n=1 Tax=Campylobacter pinnipediorum subsp. caledonicus TaxID=1874362 RepID=A0A1S6U840_9BACT|nr:hypothetical protein [Campylobacter pinnipediorum]AQW87914.1 hypothetical protein CPIN18021_1115 [Campylobacter pinnipediorum subsp. caledonicus]
MKISMIASATIIGAMMTINAYGGSSLDEINNAQKEKSDFIKKLEEVSKDGFLENLKQEQLKKQQEKEQAQQQKTAAERARDEANKAKTAAEQARDEANKAKTAAEQARDEANKAKTAAEQARDEANKAKTAAEQARDEANTAKEQAKQSLETAKQEKQQAQQARQAAERAKKEAEQQKTEAEGQAFGNSGKTKELNEIIEKDNVLGDTFQKLSSNNFKGSKQDLEKAIEVFNDSKYLDYKLVELYQDSAGNQNEQKLCIRTFKTKVSCI